MKSTSVVVYLACTVVFGTFSAVFARAADVPHTQMALTLAGVSLLCALADVVVTTATDRNRRSR